MKMEGDRLHYHELTDTKWHTITDHLRRRTEKTEVIICTIIIECIAYLHSQHGYIVPLTMDFLLDNIRAKPVAISRALYALTKSGIVTKVGKPSIRKKKWTHFCTITDETLIGIYGIAPFMTETVDTHAYI